MAPLIAVAVVPSPGGDMSTTALGAYLGRDLGGAPGLVLFIAGFAAIVGLNLAAARGRERLAIGLLLGLSVAPVLADYATRLQRLLLLIDLFRGQRG